ncbi:hypothetical protein L7F22_036316 [Adiantum nelumboides]|nr:hypothetical protein [Adiantum nelumboides]
MAHRQLGSLVRRIHRPLAFSPPHTFQYSLDVQQRQRVAEHFGLNKLGNRFFSKASPPRKATGKVASVPEKVVSSQGQGSLTHTPPRTEEAPQDQARGSKSSEQSSSNKILILGAGAALVIGLVTFFPWDLLKSYYVVERKDTDVSMKSSKEKNSEDIMLPRKEKQGREEKNHVPENLKDSPPIKNQETANVILKPRKETHDGETGRTENAELLTKTSAKSAYPDATETISVLNVFPPSDHVPEKNSAIKANVHKASEAQLKDEVSPLSGPVKEHSSSLPGDSNSNGSLGTSEKRDEVVPISHHQKESLTEDFLNNKDPNLIETISNGALKRPSLLEAYYLGESNSTFVEDNENLIERKDDLIIHGQEGSNKVVKIRFDAVGKHKGRRFCKQAAYRGVQNVFDLLDVVHAAEKRQAELDAQLYTEAQKRLKEAFQQELKDAQAKEVMYAEEANRLAKTHNIPACFVDNHLELQIAHTLVASLFEEIVSTCTPFSPELDEVENLVEGDLAYADLSSHHIHRQLCL